MAKKKGVTSSRTKGSPETPSTELSVVEAQEEAEETVADLIGTSFAEPYYLAITIPKPNEKEYDFKKDEMRIGFQHGYSVKTPTYLLSKLGLTEDQADLLSGWFFLSNPKTGLRPGEDKKPWSSTQCDLSKGVNNYSCLPPKYVWEEGMWLNDFIMLYEGEERELPVMLRTAIDAIDWATFPKDKVPSSLYQYWVVSGEGTPGNNRWRVYEVPEDIASQKNPKHPLMWPARLKDAGGKKSTTATRTSGSGSWSSGSGSSGSGSSSATKTKTLPAGLRIRCVGCGHWFKMNDLSGHADCCPGTQEDSVSDWAIMCDERCGCRTLDEASTPKPGFPRPKPEAKKDETPATGGSEAAEEGTASGVAVTA